MPGHTLGIASNHGSARLVPWRVPGKHLRTCGSACPCACLHTCLYACRYTCLHAGTTAAVRLVAVRGLYFFFGACRRERALLPGCHDDTASAWDLRAVPADFAKQKRQNLPSSLASAALLDGCGTEWIRVGGFPAAELPNPIGHQQFDSGTSKTASAFGRFQ